jgi:pimeloyl-ACP methyl ester carboxylesterase
MPNLRYAPKRLSPRRIAVCMAVIVASSTATPDRSPAAEKPAGPAANARKVDVGGYKLTLSARGAGGPTVVIEAGFGCPAVESDEWKVVCDEIAKTNLVCVYDRLGLGSSDPFPTKKARTSRDAARDLHNLLKAANVPGPYVIVAHSMGGLHARVYTEMYPDDVAGIVLADAAHPDQDTSWLAAFPREAAGEDPAVARARAFLKKRLADPGDNPEQLDVAATQAQARAVKSFGGKPLAVLTHSPDWKMVPDLPDDVLKPIEQVTQDLQAGTAKLSTDSSHTVATKAGHAIHVEDPDLVIKAIREVVAKVNAARAGKRRSE